MRSTISSGLVVTLILAGVSVRAQEKKDQNANRLIGTYKLVSGKRGDQKVPKDHLDGVVRIMSETITTYDNDNKEVYSIKYSLDREKTPHRISMMVSRSSRPEAVGSKALGLIKTQGDKLMMIYDFKGDEYPDDFVPDDDSQHYFEMERTGEK